MIADHDGFKQTSGNDISLQPDTRLSSNRDPMNVIMNKIPHQDGLRVGKLSPGRLTAPYDTILYSHPLDLLAEHHAIDLDPTENNPLPVEETNRMAASVIDGHIANFNILCPIGPLTDMESTHHSFTPLNRHLIHSSPNELDSLLAMNSHILRVVARLDEDCVSFLCSIHRLLKRDVVPCPIQRNYESPRAR